MVFDLNVVFKFMFTRHFVKILVTFTGMIVLGLIGVLLTNYYNQNSNESIFVNTIAEVEVAE